jgi:hypothetical protein
MKLPGTRLIMANDNDAPVVPLPCLVRGTYLEKE